MKPRGPSDTCGPRCVGGTQALRLSKHSHWTGQHPQDLSLPACPPTSCCSRQQPTPPTCIHTGYTRSPLTPLSREAGGWGPDPGGWGPDPSPHSATCSNTHSVGLSPQACPSVPGRHVPRTLCAPPLPLPRVHLGAHRCNLVHQVLHVGPPWLGGVMQVIAAQAHHTANLVSTWLLQACRGVCVGGQGLNLLQPLTQKPSRRPATLNPSRPATLNPSRPATLNPSKPAP